MLQKFQFLIHFDRGRSYNIYLSLNIGTSIGTVISLVTSGFIAANPSLGWEGIFYLHGGLSLFWCVLWVVFVYDTPNEHSHISEIEKEYIQNDQSSRTASKDVIFR